MSKKVIIISLSAVLALGLVVGGYFWWMKFRQTPADADITAAQAVTDIQETVDAVNQRVIDDMYAGEDGATSNPMADVPDVNPYRNTNPFSDVKTNPFE